MKKIKIARNKTINTLRGLSFKKKALLALAGLTIICLIAGAAVVFLDKEAPNSKENEPNPTNPLIEERKVTGADPAQFIKYHEDAVAAWNAGDKEKAKELAQKGLDLNDQLTNDQLTSIQDQSEKIYDMSDILRGSYEEE